MRRRLVYYVPELIIAGLIGFYLLIEGIKALPL